MFLDGQIHDTDRSDFLHRYLLALCRGCERADVRGFFHWSLTDNFEWHSGYAERFGLIYVDYPTQKRILKDSAHWNAQTARENGRNPELFFVYSGAVSAPLIFCSDPNRDPYGSKNRPRGGASASGSSCFWERFWGIYNAAVRTLSMALAASFWAAVVTWA